VAALSPPAGAAACGMAQALKMRALITSTGNNHRILDIGSFSFITVIEFV
jgi:hypothetical protein